METTGALTVTEAAQLLGVDATTVRRRLVRGDMRGVKVGPRAWIISTAEVERWQGRGKLRPGPKPGKQTEGRTAR